MTDKKTVIIGHSPLERMTEAVSRALASHDAHKFILVQGVDYIEKSTLKNFEEHLKAEMLIGRVPVIDMKNSTWIDLSEPTGPLKCESLEKDLQFVQFNKQDVRKYWFQWDERKNKAFVKRMKKFANIGRCSPFKHPQERYNGYK